MPSRNNFFANYLKQLQQLGTFFNLVKSFFNVNDVLLQHIRSICTDDALALLEFVTLVKNKLSEVMATHYILHHQAFVSKLSLLL